MELLEGGNAGEGTSADGCVGAPYPRASSPRAVSHWIAYPLVRVGMHLGCVRHNFFSFLFQEGISSFKFISLEASIIFLISTKALYELVIAPALSVPGHPPPTPTSSLL